MAWRQTISSILTRASRDMVAGNTSSGTISLIAVAAAITAVHTPTTYR